MTGENLAENPDYIRLFDTTSRTHCSNRDLFLRLLVLKRCDKLCVTLTRLNRIAVMATLNPIEKQHMRQLLPSIEIGNGMPLELMR